MAFFAFFFEEEVIKTQDKKKTENIGQNRLFASWDTGIIPDKVS